MLLYEIVTAENPAEKIEEIKNPAEKNEELKNQKMKEKIIELIYKAGKVFENAICSDDEAVEILAMYLIENGVKI